MSNPAPSGSNPPCVCDDQSPILWGSGRMVCLNCGDEVCVLDLLADVVDADVVD
jgi:hypothetical protein